MEKLPVGVVKSNTAKYILLNQMQSSPALEKVKEYLVKQHVQEFLMDKQITIEQLTDPQFETLITSFPFDRKYLLFLDFQRLLSKYT